MSHKQSRIGAFFSRLFHRKNKQSEEPAVLNETSQVQPSVYEQPKAETAPVFDAALLAKTEEALMKQTVIQEPVIKEPVIPEPVITTQEPVAEEPAAEMFAAKLENALTEAAAAKLEKVSAETAEDVPAEAVVDAPAAAEEDSTAAEAAEEESTESAEEETETEIKEEKRPAMKKKKIRKQVFMNREFSWIRFNERVLEEAEKTEVPMAERLNFASIYQTNMDEFFMVRMGKLIHRDDTEGKIKDSKSGMTPKDQISSSIKRIKNLISRRDRVYAELLDELKKQGICIVDPADLSEEEKASMDQLFEEQIRPGILPCVVVSKQNFPFLPNKAIEAVAAMETKENEKVLGIVPCEAGGVGRLIPVGEGSGRFVLSEELILQHMEDIFKGYEVKEKALIRVTRNADIDADVLYTEEYDYREFVAEVMKKRGELPVVRMEMTHELDAETVDELTDYLEIAHKQVFSYQEPLDLSFFSDIRDMLPQDTGLFYPARSPQPSAQFDMDRPILPQILEGDKLLSYPYESIDPFLQMLHEAANDEKVISIQMTLYRVAKRSKVIEALVEAAENGKEVNVLVELKARFDEEANIDWSRKLEAAGCHVIYGIKGYKIHSKLCLITRRADGYNQYITQIGTGNYNEKTSKIYTDLCMMTSDQAIGRDAAWVFTALKKQEFVEKTEQLLVAPLILKDRVIEEIDRQIQIAKDGGNGYIGLKMNSLSDTKVMFKLVEASMAGVQVDMIIRGVCCLIPGVPELTENIHIYSIVGRFLEHARVFIFGTKEAGQSIYLGSADLMKRNTSNRVEIAAPVLDESLKDEIRTLFEIQLSDNVQSREMLSDGTYAAVKNEEAPISSQEYFYEHAYRQAGELLPEEKTWD